MTYQRAMTPLTPGSLLCLDCGICCRGILFDNAALAQEYGLDGGWSGGAESGPLLPLACPLHRGGRCAVYDHRERPPSCPEYRCELLNKLDAGEICLDEGRLIVDKVKMSLSKFIERLPSGGKPKPAYYLAIDTLSAAQEKLAAGDRSDFELLTDILLFRRLLCEYFIPIEDQ